MSETTTYSAARAHLAALCDRVAATREPVIIRRRNAADVALIAADELAGLMETAHLLRSPRNAERLLSALARAEAREMAPSSPAQLRASLKLTDEHLGEDRQTD